MTIARRSITRIRILVPIALVAIAALLVLTVPGSGGDRPVAPGHSSEQRTSPVVDPAAPLAGDVARDSGMGNVAVVGAEGRAFEQPVDKAAAAVGATSEADGSAISIQPTPTTLAAPNIDQRIARTASIQLRTKRRSFEDAWGDAQAVARSVGGYVVSSSRSGGGSSARSASISLRVPSAKFDAAVAAVRGIDGAKVERLDIASQDVSQEYVDTTSRLRHDRAVEARLLSLLAATKSVSEVLAVQARLDQVQEAIEVSAGRIKYLDSVTSMSTIDVTLRVPPAAGSPTAADGSRLGEALSDGAERFVSRISGGIIWVGGALPVLMLLGFILLVGRFSVRRYRAR
jgi:hypothetical protein